VTQDSRAYEQSRSCYHLNGPKSALPEVSRVHSVEIVPLVEYVEYSFVRTRHTGALRTLPRCPRSFAKHSLAQTYTLLSREPTCFVTAWRIPCCAPGPR